MPEGANDAQLQAAEEEAEDAEAEDSEEEEEEEESPSSKVGSSHGCHPMFVCHRADLTMYRSFSWMV